jgi:hypothetical protein
LQPKIGFEIGYRVGKEEGRDRGGLATCPDNARQTRLLTNLASPAGPPDGGKIIDKERLKSNN